MAVRGCGFRVEGGLYASAPLSPDGMPIEYFLIDPVIPFEAAGRAPLMIESKRHNGVLNAVLGVGAESYPFVPDFVEEARIMGVSKRFPRNFPVEKLTPYKSRLILGHSRAIPLFFYKLAPQEKCPKGASTTFGDEDFHDCIKNLWPLSTTEGYLKHRLYPLDEETGQRLIKTPSTTYTAYEPMGIEKLGVKKHTKCPYCGSQNFEEFTENWGQCYDCGGDTHMIPPLPYAPGLFISLPLSHFEFISKTNEVPTDLAERFEESGWKLEVCEE